MKQILFLFVILISSCKVSNIDFYKAIVNDDEKTVQKYMNEHNSDTQIFNNVLLSENEKLNFQKWCYPNYALQYKVKDDNDLCPAKLAIYSKSANVFENFLNNGLSINSIYNDGESLLSLCVKTKEISNVNNFDNLFKVFLDNNADVNIKNNNGQNILHIATLSKFEMQSDLFINLIKATSNINELDKNGYTSLMYAAERLHKNYISVLIKNNADKSIKNRDGKTALQLLGSKSNLFSKTDNSVKKDCYKIFLNLYSYDNWSPNRFVIQSEKNLGAKIAIIDGIILSLDSSNQITITDKNYSNAITAIFDNFDYETNMNLSEKILSLQPKHLTSQPADFYGYISNEKTTWGYSTCLHITHIIN